MPFRNLYLQLDSFRDHNFSDFLGRLEEVKDEFLEAKYREGYFDRGIEPYFEPIIPLTLHPTACDGFFRTGPKWPITKRDYYLSKLFQFVFPPIRIKYEIDDDHEYRLTERIEEILEQTPDEILPDLYRWNWWDFYEDTFHLELDPLLERLSDRLGKFCLRVKQGLPVETASEDRADRPRRRRRRPPETVERDSIIVNCLNRDMERHKICRMLDEKGIPTTPGLRAKGLHRWTEAFTDPGTEKRVQSIISKALNKGILSSEKSFH